MKTACLSNAAAVLNMHGCQNGKKRKKRTILEHYVMMVCSIRYNWCVLIIAFLFRVYIFSVRSPRNWYVFIWFACFTISMMPLFIRIVKNHFLCINGSHKRENILCRLTRFALLSTSLSISLSLWLHPSDLFSLFFSPSLPLFSSPLFPP